MTEKIASIGGMIVSGIFTLVGLLFATGTLHGVEMYWTAHEKYGGDAYTGIQNAAADTANQISRLMEGMDILFGILLITIGTLAFFYFLGKYSSTSRLVAMPAAPVKSLEDELPIL